MAINYYTNGKLTTKSLTEWFFGEKFVRNLTASAVRMHNKSGETKFKFWQNGTGYMTVEVL